MSVDLLVYNAAELVVGASSESDETLETYENAALAVKDGTVEAVGPSDKVLFEHPVDSAATSVDASERAVVPGFVDPHTHAVFAGERADEFEAKLRGKTYQQILAEGGGILRTVQSTRQASNERLLSNLLGHLDTMLAHGTTTVEVKSGYGLDTETELRLLEVIDEADRQHPVDVVPTFMGAHAVPPDQSTAAYVDTVVEDQLPAVADQGIAAFCDVFCEEDVFSVEQSRRVLEAGIERGLTPKVHAEEFTRLGGAQLAADVGAASADHLLHATPDDIDALVEADVVPVLLPGTAFGLGADYADAAAMYDRGAPVALATDFNPNCYSQSMSFAQSLACVEMGLTPGQSLVAATEHAARALDRPDLGRLEAGYPADFCILDAPSSTYISYQFGVNVVDSVFKDGVRVHRA